MISLKGHSFLNDWKAHLLALLIIAAFSWYYFIVRAFPPSINFANAIAALSATILIGISFLLGPLSRFLPALFNKILCLRKNIGLWGYGLALLHIVLVAYALLGSKDPITFSDAISLAVAAVAFMIFTLMAITSTASWIAKLGYANWKQLQRTGYLAFALVLVHVAVIENGVFLGRLPAQIALAVILIALLLRALLYLAGHPSTTDEGEAQNLCEP